MGGKGGGQALAGARGRSTFSYYPDELTIITDPRHSLYDERVELAVSDEAVLNAVVMGIVEPVVVVKHGDEEVVDDGNQRVKRALVANALVGRAYRGPLKCVREAIDRLKKNDVGKRIMELLVDGPIRVPAIPFKESKEVTAYQVKAALNAFREDDSLALKIRKAHRMLAHSHTPRQVAESMGVSEATVRAWSKRDPDAPKVAKVRGKAKGPSRKRVLGVAAAEGMPAELAVALRWAAGDVEDAALAVAWPAVAAALGAKAA